MSDLASGVEPHGQGAVKQVHGKFFSQGRSATLGEQSFGGLLAPRHSSASRALIFFPLGSPRPWLVQLILAWVELLAGRTFRSKVWSRNHVKSSPPVHPKLNIPACYLRWPIKFVCCGRPLLHARITSDGLGRQRHGRCREKLQYMARQAGQRDSGRGW